MGRIKRDHIDIDVEKTHDFFDNRINKDLFHRYNLVNFQDDHPEVALKRDEAEKVKIMPLLEVSGSDRIIDIGCGVGRWGDSLVPKLESGEYIGIDYSENLIKVASESKPVNEPNYIRRYFVGSFQDVLKTLEYNKVDTGFDIVIINGVLMYINDSDIDICLNNVLKLKNQNSRIYIKESVGVSDRFTLKDIYSDELTSQYNAIYRGISEYQALFDDMFGRDGLVSKGDVLMILFTTGKKQPVIIGSTNNA